MNCQGFCGVTSKSNDTDWTEEEQYFSSSVSIADKGTEGSWSYLHIKWQDACSNPLQILLICFPGTLKEGEHSFPFKFLLPGTTRFYVIELTCRPAFLQDLSELNHCLHLSSATEQHHKNPLCITK